MSKWIAGCLAATMIGAFLIVSCGFVSVVGAGEKHTGPVIVRSVSRGGLFVELIRSNGEFFEMRFQPDGTGPNLTKGDSLGDLVYSDEKNRYQFFIKAVLVSEAPIPPTVDKILYDESANYGFTCSNGGCQQVPSGRHEFYRWADGGYRDHPEKK